MGRVSVTWCHTSGKDVPSPVELMRVNSGSASLNAGISIGQTMVRSLGYTERSATSSVHEGDSGPSLIEWIFSFLFFSRRVSLVLFGLACNGHLIPFSSKHSRNEDIDTQVEHSAFLLRGS